MISNRERLEEQIEHFEELLVQFEIEKDHLVKGVMLNTLHKQRLVVNTVIGEQTSLTDRRRMQTMFRQKQEKFLALEKEFIVKVDTAFYYNQIVAFTLIAAPFYFEHGNGQQMKECLSRFCQILKSYGQLKQMFIHNCVLQEEIERVQSLYKEEIVKFQRAFSRDVLSFQRLQNDNSEDNKQNVQQNQRIQENELVFETNNMEEKQKEIAIIVKEIRQIDETMNQISQLVAQQGEELNVIENYTADTAKTLISTEKEIQSAKKDQIKYQSKMLPIKGAAFGGGIGFFVGGPIGIGVGTFLGASIGKVVHFIITKDAQ